jgi:hypothetical protein
MTKTKTKDDPCERIMTRQDKLTKWEKIYSKAMGVIKDNLGIDKDAVYAACHAIQTGSREIGIIERIMRLNGELVDERTSNTGDSIGWGDISGQGSEADA